MNILKGHALDLLEATKDTFDLIATDPPYAFGGSGGEHALSATVATVLRECARHLTVGGALVVFCASSWRSTAYMIESLRGLAEPVRFGFWGKPSSKTKARTFGWAWASVHVLVFRRGGGWESDKSTGELDHIIHEPHTGGRRAQLPEKVADWAVRPFATVPGRMLDPFAGSGALCLAAERAGMEAVGYELNPDDERRSALVAKPKEASC